MTVSTLIACCERLGDWQRAQTVWDWMTAQVRGQHQHLPVFHEMWSRAHWLAIMPHSVPPRQIAERGTIHPLNAP